jgi:hypothetical protein
MHCKNSVTPAVALVAGLVIFTSSVKAFEGRITAASTQGGQTIALLYTVGTNALRLEVTGSDQPNPVDVLDRNSGELTLLFPHNRSFVRLKPVPENPAMPPGFPGMPAGMPPGVGPQTQIPPTAPPANIGPTNLPGMPAIPAMPQAPAAMGVVVPGGMPAMPMMSMPGEVLELKATGDKTNLLGFACERFEIKQRGEIMEIWATDGLLPFQDYVRNQPPRFGPRMIEERWAGLLTAKKLFPLRASLRFGNGPERFRFEILSVTPQKLKPEDAPFFLPPDGYFEIQPLPF